MEGSEGGGYVQRTATAKGVDMQEVSKVGRG